MKIGEVRTSPFKEHRQAIFTAALNLYFAKKSGIELSEEDARVMLPRNVGDGSKTDYEDAEKVDAQVNVAARSICEFALRRDRIEQKLFVIGIFDRIEDSLARIIDRQYIGEELGPDGLIEQVRGN